MHEGGRGQRREGGVCEHVLVEGERNDMEIFRACCAQCGASRRETVSRRKVLAWYG